MQEPTEAPFDINSVPKEVKSQPLAEKKVANKKPTGLGAPPISQSSGADAYEKLLSSIPEFSAFGKLFKVLWQNLFNGSVWLCDQLFYQVSFTDIV